MLSKVAVRVSTRNSNNTELTNDDVNRSSSRAFSTRNSLH